MCPHSRYGSSCCRRKLKLQRPLKTAIITSPASAEQLDSVAVARERPKKWRRVPPACSAHHRGATDDGRPCQQRGSPESDRISAAHPRPRVGDNHRLRRGRYSVVDCEKRCASRASWRESRQPSSTTRQRGDSAAASRASRRRPQPPSTARTRRGDQAEKRCEFRASPRLIGFPLLFPDPTKG